MITEIAVSADCHLSGYCYFLTSGSGMNSDDSVAGGPIFTQKGILTAPSCCLCPHAAGAMTLWQSEASLMGEAHFTSNMGGFGGKTSAKGFDTHAYGIRRGCSTTAAIGA